MKTARSEQHTQHHIGAWRQLGGHFTLTPPQYKRVQLLLELGGHAGLARGNGTLVAFLKGLTPAEQTTI